MSVLNDIMKKQGTKTKNETNYDRRNKHLTIGAVSLVLVIVATVITVSIIKPCSTSPTGFAFLYCSLPDGNNVGYEEALAKCLTAKGVMMYGSKYCGHCTAQKETFGEAFQYINYIECAESSACSDAGISAVPTWVDAQGNKYSGNKKLSDLAQLFGC